MIHKGSALQLTYILLPGASIANYRTNIFAILRGMFEICRGISEFLFIRRFPLTMFCGTLVGKHLAGITQTCKMPLL